MKTAALDYQRQPRQEAVGPPEWRGISRDGVRLLVSRAGRHAHARFSDLPSLLKPGTLLVVNRSATLPAGLPATGRWGEIRLNLSTAYGRGLWLAEPRWDVGTPGPLPISSGDPVRAAGLPGRFVAPYPAIPRLWFVRIAGDLYEAMARTGEPIRYSYLRPPFPPLAAYQTIFADTPGSAEMPSAARPFTRRTLVALARRGIAIKSIILHSGVSSLEVKTDAVKDHALYPEPFRVPVDTAAAVNAARRQGRPVIAVGTTVVRALESAWDGGRVHPRAGFTSRFVHPGRPVETVDGLVTGLHEPRASHLAMLFSLADPAVVRQAYAEAVREGYLWHEFGDTHLIQRSSP